LRRRSKRPSPGPRNIVEDLKFSDGGKTMAYLILIPFFLVLAYLTFSVFYTLFLAVVSLFVKREGKAEAGMLRKYLLMIPAHNEERIIDKLILSMKEIDYPEDKMEIIVVADNCEDATAGIATRQGIRVLERVDETGRGKGFAIAWALQKVDLDAFDALVIIDADNYVDPLFLKELNRVVDEGYEAIQCYNNVGNSDTNSFTRLICLSRTINNELYHFPKFKLGLSSFLMGNGMCFGTGFLKKFGWSTHTIAEDYEYYAKIIKAGEVVGYALKAKLFHQESRGIRQATNQRLRWSAGRFQVAYQYGLDLLKKGVKEKSYRIIDASFPLLLPNLSLMVNMTLICLVFSLFIYWAYGISAPAVWVLFLLVLEILYFASGILLTRISLWKIFVSFLYAPLFLAWKACIDVVGIIWRKKRQWVASQRG
jgi:cellulose synthase/poly-beta-1,6-N-acetylglucosamine synthase-like glycosyltransferase